MGSPPGRFQTVLAVNLATVFERSSEQILPSLYAYVAKSFGSSPTHLGFITLARSVTQAALSPAGGLAGNIFPRGNIVGFGCLLWGLCAFIFACTSSIATAIPAWALAGGGLALIVPNAQSLVADYYDSSSRGQAFGVMHLAGSAGGMAGALAATNIASVGRIWHFQGWRIALFGAGMFAAAVAALNFIVARDPKFSEREREYQLKLKSKTYKRTLEDAWNALLAELTALAQVPSFILIVCQGIFGNIPWSALVYLTLYFQLLGMSAFAASLLVALFMAGVAVGGLLGGLLGDAAAVKWPLHGRVFVAQISVAAGIPFAFILTRGMHHGDVTASPAIYGAVLVLFGLVKAWPAPACNNPVFAEIVPESKRKLIYAFDRCFETAVAACTAPLVGVMAQKVFGFDGTATPTGDPSSDRKNANALGEALLAFMVVPWPIDLVLYTGLHWTLGPDVRRAAHAHAVPVVGGSPVELEALADEEL